MIRNVMFSPIRGCKTGGVSISTGCTRGYSNSTPDGVASPTRICRNVEGNGGVARDAKFLICNGSAVSLSRQGQYIGRNMRETAVTVPSGTECELPRHIAYLTARRRIPYNPFFTDILSLTGQGKSLQVKNCGVASPTRICRNVEGSDGVVNPTRICRNIEDCGGVARDAKFLICNGSAVSLSRQGQYIGRNMRETAVTVPSGTECELPRHIAYLTARRRILYNPFFTDILSLTGQGKSLQVKNCGVVNPIRICRNIEGSGGSPKDLNVNNRGCNPRTGSAPCNTTLKGLNVEYGL